MKFSNYDISPKPEIGQHFLTNQKILDLVAMYIPSGSKILEIGVGPGQLTEKLSKKASYIKAVEIDRQFLPILKMLQRRNRNIDITIEDALELDFKKYQDFWIVGNLPYHITEPLITKIAKAPSIKGAIFLVGKSFAEESLAIPSNMESFGKLSLIVYAFFNFRILAEITKEDFDPRPRTDSSLIILYPRKNEKYQNIILFLTHWLILGSKRSALIKNSLMEGLINYEKQQSNRVLTKNQAREIVSKLNLSVDILDKPFEQLNNKQYLILYNSLDSTLLS